MKIQKTSGSPVVTSHLDVGAKRTPEFTRKNAKFLKADGGIWEFGGAGIDGVQEAWLGLKGVFFVELEVERLTKDVHSGTACVLPSAAYRLVWALASLKDEDDKILIDGFYDDAKPLSAAELDAIKKIDMHEKMWRTEFGIDEYLMGLSGDALKEAYYNAPTCNICGLTSGYQGKGSMTVLPAKASVKIDFRLVEDMDPNDIHRKLRLHLDRHDFTDVKIPYSEGYAAAKTPVDHPFVQIVAKANEKVFGNLRIHPTSPGSGPLYLFKEHVPMVSIGCGDYESSVHSPNESIILENYRKSMHRLVYVIDEMGHW